MISIEKQKEILANIKKQKKNKVKLALGIIFIIVGALGLLLGYFYFDKIKTLSMDNVDIIEEKLKWFFLFGLLSLAFLISGSILLKKRYKSIRMEYNEKLIRLEYEIKFEGELFSTFSDTENQIVEQTFQEENLTKSKIKVETLEDILNLSKEERIELSDRLVNTIRRKKHYNLVSDVIGCIILTISVLCLIFVPFGSNLGIESVSAYDILKDMATSYGVNADNSLVGAFKDDSWINLTSIIICCLLCFIIISGVVDKIWENIKISYKKTALKIENYIKEVLKNPSQFSIDIYEKVKISQLERIFIEGKDYITSAVIASILAFASSICLPIAWNVFMEGLFKLNYITILITNIILIFGVSEMLCSPISRIANPRNELYQSDKKLIKQILSAKRTQIYG